MVFDPEFIKAVIVFAIVFFSQLAQVFTLVTGSKLLRDDRWELAMANSLLITLTQFIFVKAVSTQSPEVVVLAAGFGGAVGCGLSHHFYTYWSKRYEKYKEKKELAKDKNVVDNTSTPKH